MAYSLVIFLSMCKKLDKKTDTSYLITSTIATKHKVVYNWIFILQLTCTGIKKLQTDPFL